MNRFKTKLMIAAGLAALAITGAIVNSRDAAAQGPPNGLDVRIVNSVTLPVSGTVNVGNQGGTPLQVAVTNFPATQNVVVLNQPGSAVFSATLTSASPSLVIPSTIPSTPGAPPQTVKSVVITEVSGSCIGIGSYNIGLQDVVGGNPATTFYFAVAGDLQNGAFQMLAHESNIFIAAGHSIAITDNLPPHGCRVDLSGYYVTP